MLWRTGGHGFFDGTASSIPTRSGARDQRVGGRRAHRIAARDVGATSRQCVGGVDEATVALLLKALGICLLTQLTADVCRDAGETALATHAEFAGKVALLLLILPLFVQIVDLAVTFIDGG